MGKFAIKFHLALIFTVTFLIQNVLEVDLLQLPFLTLK